VSNHGPASRPCTSCPYRREVPSGVWAAQEYDKLPLYDAPTWGQPASAFFCHQTSGERLRLCAGWVGCHDMYESLGLRCAFGAGLIDAEDVKAAIGYDTPVPLFMSGAEAAEHGKAEIEDPSDEAKAAVLKVTTKREDVRFG